jgi:hypothetical protein
MKQKTKLVTSGEKNGMYGKKHSIESIEKNRKSNIGKKHSDETKKIMSKAHKGKKMNDAFSEKLKKSWAIRKENGYVMTMETKEKIRQSKINKPGHKGLIHSEETKRKISQNKKGILLGPQDKETINKRIERRKQNGPWVSEETKIKISQSKKGKKIILPKKKCKYCGKMCASHIIVRFHDDNCKFKV